MPAYLTFLVVTVLVAVVAAARGVFSPCGLSMISAINPFSEYSRGNRYWLTALWFIAGSVVGGTLLGCLSAVGAVGWSLIAGPFAPTTPSPAGTTWTPVVTTLTAFVAALCCLVALASDSPAVSFTLPRHPRQVNEYWLARYRRWIYAAGFGVQIGSGFATYIMTAAVYLTAVLGALSGSVAVALAIGLVFGSVRGVAVLLSGRARDPAALRRLHRRLDLLAPWSLRAAILVQALAAVAFGYLTASAPGAGLVTILIAAGGIRAWTRIRRTTIALSTPLSNSR